ncbi:MAG TPA: flagellar motor protein MotB [Syntrophomonadaceae bacterium]|nr:flagellar motor protein MotB [Syntrophomonadaceae bacterium]
MPRPSRRSKRKQKTSSHEGGQERWLVTYADLITLLMIFFVLMYSMSQVDAQKYQAVANSLSVVLTGEAITVLEGQGPSIIENKSGEILPVDTGKLPDNQTQINEVKELIADFIASQEAGAGIAGSGKDGLGKNLDEHIVVYEQERGLVISFKDTLLFSSASADLAPQARSIIKQIGMSLVDLPNYIRVEGHTDNLPINTAKFPSNWELSVLRSANVVHVLTEEAGLPAERLSISGYGEYRPLVPNDNKSNQSINRRVDIVILKTKYDYFEPPSVDSKI